MEFTDLDFEYLGSFHGWVYELIFAVFGGITADIEFVICWRIVMVAGYYAGGDDR